ncbi:MAG: heavy metal translocating P-type ATPase [Polynucleobacter sp.]|nr:heavy metal translocating P-type ATPase [Polynucleobacter sp.]
MNLSSKNATRFVSIDIEGMTCASCVGRVEKALANMPGIEAATVNLATEQARIRLTEVLPGAVEQIIEIIHKVGYGAKQSAAPGQQKQVNQSAFWSADGLGLVLLSFALSAPLVLPMVLMPFGVHWIPSGLWQLLLASPVQFVFGWRFYRSGFKALMSGAGNMDLLVALGTSAAYGLSVYQLAFGDPHALYFEGAAVIISMVLLGKWLEARAKQKTGEAIRALHALWPQQARVLKTNDLSLISSNAVAINQHTELALEHVLINDLVMVLPGERVPADGLIVLGSSHLDESLLTGESQAVKRGIGDAVIGGSLNGDGQLVFRVSASSTDSMLANIIDLVETAQTQKAPIQRLVDQVSAIFVPAVIGIAIATGLITGLLIGDVSEAILRAVSIMVIACPCALGLATPAAIMAGTGVAARAGILIKDPQVLELAHRIQLVAFDKTGTLTEGKPTLLSIDPSLGLTQEGVLALAAGLQMGSEHPLAKAVLEDAKLRGVTPATCSQMQAIPGVGIEGRLLTGEWQGQLLRLQSLASLESHPQYGDLILKAAPLFLAGHSVSALTAIPLDAHASTPLAIFAFGDAIKDNAAAAVRQLYAMGIQTVMLSGDNRAAAEQVGQRIGIGTVHAQVIPSDKAGWIERLKRNAAGERQWVAMVGDGINDAPALAMADVGMAMATGTDVAMQAAGITLMHGNPTLVASAIDVSKRTWNKIRQNLFWAFAFNVIGIPLAAMGYLTPAIAGSAMALSSLFVLSNALLLGLWKPK